MRHILQETKHGFQLIAAGLDYLVAKARLASYRFFMSETVFAALLIALIALFIYTV